MAIEDFEEIPPRLEAAMDNLHDALYRMRREKNPIIKSRLRQNAREKMEIAADIDAGWLARRDIRQQRHGTN